jgi:hypothetical protein
MPWPRRQTICKCGQPCRPNQATCRACHAAYRRRRKDWLRAPKFRDKSPEDRRKIQCRTNTNNLVQRGTLKRLPCVDCGAVKVQAHHPDYSNHRNVIWLCVACHTKRHLAVSA